MWPILGAQKFKTSQKLRMRSSVHLFCQVIVVISSVQETRTSRNVGSTYWVRSDICKACEANLTCEASEPNETSGTVNLLELSKLMIIYMKLL